MLADNGKAAVNAPGLPGRVDRSASFADMPCACRKTVA
jgi:hypothetical protein